MLAAGMFLYVGAELGTANWLARFFAEELSANGVLAAGTVSIFWGGITVGRFLTGVIAKHFRDVTIIRVSLILALIGQFGILFSRTPLSAAVFVGLLGLCMASVWPTILAHAGDVFSHQLESAFSVIVGAGCFGAIFIPPAIGAVSDFAGWRMALAICPLLGIINITVFTMITRRERRR
jgi:fucose permease